MTPVGRVSASFQGGVSKETWERSARTASLHFTPLRDFGSSHQRPAALEEHSDELSPVTLAKDNKGTGIDRF